MQPGDVDALKAAIRDVPDFPKPGIVFKDITPLLKNPSTLRLSADLMADLSRQHAPGKVIAVESRGFILGSLVADRMGVGFVPVRKPGKLPSSTVQATYDLEYGQDTLEIHRDAVEPGESVVVVDDVLATGGTARATGELVTRLGGRVAAYVFLIELAFLGGRAKLGTTPVLSLITY